MKSCGKLISILIFLGTLFLAESALAGETGKVFCTTSGCGYQTNLQIGGGRRSPAVTGYCPQQKRFVRLKIRNWEDYRQPHYCPTGKERLQPIYEGSEVSKIPCPQCGNLSLKYQRRLMFD